MKHAFLLIGLWLLTLSGFAQAIRLSDQPEPFITDVQKLMASGGPAAVKAGTDLQTLWSENRLTAAQQTRIIAITRQMVQKRWAVANYETPFFSALYQGITAQAMTPENIDGLLSVVENLLTTDSKVVAQSLQTIRRFLENRQLYVSNYNKLYALGGTFGFRLAENTPTATNPNPVTDSLASAKASAERSRFDGWDTPAADSTAPKSLGVRYIPQRRPLPAVTGPLLTLNGVTLAMVANGDSVLLTQTSGDVLLKTQTLVGKGGQFSWAMLERPDIFVTLSDYALRFSTPTLQADDVTLTYGSMKPVQGVFEYVSKKKTTGPAQYPRFMSWQSDATLPDLGPNLDYRGGLALAGTQLVGTSASGQVSQLTVKNNGKAVFKADARRFLLGDSLISAPSAAFTGYIATDSMTHPSVQFRYDKAQRIAWLDREVRNDFARVPYVDTYHQFFIMPEVVRWDVSRQKVDFYQVAAKSEVPVRLESFDYFQPQRYSDIAIDYGFHPLQIVGNYVATKKTQTFLDDDITTFAPRVNAAALRGALNRMVTEGYIDRDPRTQLMRLSRKGTLYVLANANRHDYDNFQILSFFPSNDSTKNATLNLNDNILTVRGVSSFVISDTLKIVGFPSDKTLRLGKGRSFTLNGKLRAGTMRYAGRNLNFDYNTFAMNMSQIDSITFASQKRNLKTTRDTTAQQAAAETDSEVGGDIKYEKPGTVYLGSADNKSGRVKGKKTTQRLVMPEGMTVYFDQPVRGDRTYNRKVYFKIPAIDNDSLGKGDISFQGTFYSDGILPPIKAQLQTMPDNTLGFVHKAPANGYPLYGTQSAIRATGPITMDKTGLHTEGVLNHLTGQFQADNVLLLADSLVASGPKGELKEGAAGKGYFPAVQLTNYALTWWPKADSMTISTQKKNFMLYNASTQLEGSLVLRSTGLYGKGTLHRKDAETVSDNIRFTKEGFIAQRAGFTVIPETNAPGTQAGKPFLLANGVTVDFNQAKALADLSIPAGSGLGFGQSDTTAASIDFPFAAYKTNISRAQWNIAAKTITMKADGKSPSVFTATASDQEGLTFGGTAAVYDIAKSTLNISGVPYVTAADARIYPDKGLVSIRRNGQMLPLKNARLVMDTTNLFHHLKNGNIQIESRARFSGDATYLYPLAKGDTASIKMGNFELKEGTLAADNTPTKRGKRTTNPNGKTAFTVARADIDEDHNLLLAPQIQYKGAVLMQAPDHDLDLNGAIRPALKKRPNLVGGWIPFHQKVAERLEIPVDATLKNEGGQPLVAGLHFQAGGGGLYPTFLSPKEDSRDEDLFSATGIMRYDETDKRYRISPKGSLTASGSAAADSTDDVENDFTFDDAKGVMTYKGKLNLTANQLLASGSVRANIDSSSVRANTLLVFTFPMPAAPVQAIANKLVSTNQDEKNDDPADDDLNRLTDKLVPLIGQAATDAYRAKAQNQHVVLSQADPKLNAALVLSNVNLRWSPKYNAFYSTGRIGVSNLNTTDINAQMDGMVEIRKTVNGDEVGIYLEASPDVWVFYDFRPGNGPGSQSQLAVVTSQQELNDQLLATARNSSKSTVEIIPATADEKTQFVDQYLAQYKTRPKTAPKPKTAAKPAPTAAESKDKDAKKEGF